MSTIYKRSKNIYNIRKHQATKHFSKITPGIHEKIEAFVRKKNCTSIHDESKPPKLERIRTRASIAKKSIVHCAIEIVHAFSIVYIMVRV